MAMRAQLSLLFDDENLYDNYIKPYKEAKQLNGIIIKCLSAYFYNEDVRNLVEGVSLDEVSDSEEITSTQSIVDGIRASLIMQDFLAGELRNTIDAGTEDVNDILNRTNNVAEQTGVAKTTHTEYGADVLKIEQQNLNLGMQQVSNAKTSEDAVPNDTLKVLLMAVTKLAEASGNSEVVNLLHTRPITEQSTEVKVEPKTLSENDITKVTTNEDNEVEKIEHPNVEMTSNFEVEDDFVEEEPVVIKNDFDDISVVEPLQQSTGVATDPAPIIEDTSNTEEDASDAINELLGSLF